MCSIFACRIPPARLDRRSVSYLLSFIHAFRAVTCWNDRLSLDHIFVHRMLRYDPPWSYLVSHFACNAQWRVCAWDKYTRVLSAMAQLKWRAVMNLREQNEHSVSLVLLQPASAYADKGAKRRAYPVVTVRTRSCQLTLVPFVIQTRVLRPKGL